MSSSSAMLVFLAFGLIQLIGGAICTSLDAASSVQVSIETVSDLATFRKANPALEVVPLTSRVVDVPEAGSTRQMITYTVGSYSSSDRLVGLTSKQQSWSTPQDVKLDLQYPSAGVGAIVTYVEVVVQQSSSTGRGYIVSGGVGQRNIRLIIEAYGTLYFDYNAAIYGR